MSKPKLERILDAVAGLAEHISPANGYYTDVGCRVRRDGRDPIEQDLPCTFVSLGVASSQDQSGDAQHFLLPIEVTAFHALRAHEEPEVLGVRLLADLQRAVEGQHAVLDDLVLWGGYGLVPSSFSIELPEIGVDAVSATIVYGVSYARTLGNPEIEG